MPLPPPESPLDEGLRTWLLAELDRRVLPMHWKQSLQQLVSWASTYRDGRAIHDLLTHYERPTPAAGSEAKR